MIPFDELAKLSPINKTAYNVTSSGDHFVLENKSRNVVRSQNPLPTTTRCLPGEEDFTGRKIGRLTVIGRADLPVKDNQWPHVRWVVRCTCGWYEHRRTRVLRNIPPEDQMCSICQLFEQRKAGFGPWLREDTSKPESKIEQRIEVCEQTIEINQRSYNRPKRTPKKPIPPNLRWQVWERDNFTCQICGARRHLSIDHIIPESKGGLSVIENFQTLCMPCNDKKGAN